MRLISGCSFPFDADPQHIVTDPDPAFQFDADPEPAFNSDAESDPTFQFDPDPTTLFSPRFGASNAPK
jgi:hypothetical protein